MKKRGKARSTRRRPVVKDLTQRKASRVKGGAKEVDRSTPVIMRALTR